MAATLDSFLPIFDLGYWATYQLLDRAAALSPEEWNAAEPGERGVRGTFVHCFEVEFIWRKMLMAGPREGASSDTDAGAGEAAARQGDKLPEALPPHLSETPAAMRATWESDERDMRAWLATLDDEALAKPMPQIEEASPLPLSAYLVHMTQHTAQLRGELALLLTRLGHSPGDLDYLDYLYVTNGWRD